MKKHIIMVVAAMMAAWRCAFAGITANGVEVTSGAGDGWTVEEVGPVKVMTITGDGLTLSGKASNFAVLIPKGETRSLTIENLSLQQAHTNAPVMAVEGTLNLTVKGENHFDCMVNYAGVSVPGDAALTITEASDGILYARGGIDAAGIGGNIGQNAGRITISGGTIDANGGLSGAGIGGGEKGNGGVVTISNGAMVNAQGGPSGAGIGGGSEGKGGIVYITGGIVKASGRKISLGDGQSGAGIGGGHKGNGGSVTISGGTVTATGDDGAAGIGGGAYGGGGTVVISGGSVKAVGSVESMAQDIGYGGDGTGRGTIKNQHGESLALVKVPCGEEGAKTVSVAVSGSSAYTYTYSGLGHEGDENVYLYLPAGSHAVTVNGTAQEDVVVKDPFAAVTVNGAPLSQGSGAGWTYSGNRLSVDGTTPLTLSGYGSYLSVSVPQAVSANLVFDNFTIDAKGTGYPAVSLEKDAHVTLTVKGENVLYGGNSCAGISVPTQTWFTVSADSTGSLAAYGGSTGDEQGGAGIGGSYRVSAGTMVFNGGEVTAVGGRLAAGIGGGAGYYQGLIVIGNRSADGGNGGHVTVNGGSVTAIAGRNIDDLLRACSPGAGIGGGYTGASSDSKSNIAGASGTLIVNGGTVTARSESSAIGNGYGGGEFDGNVEINGGTVTANGGYEGIENGNGCTVTIRGGIVNAKSSGSYPGIGNSGDCGTIVISGGTVNAAGGSEAAGIGGTSGNVIITGGSIRATGDIKNRAENIGCNGSGDTTTRTNGDALGGDKLYCVALPKPEGAETFDVQVTVSRSETYTYAYSGAGHDDGYLYFWLPAGIHQINVNGTDYEAVARSGLITANGIDVYLHSGEGWTFADNVLTITGSAPVEISGSSEDFVICVQENVTANVTLNNLSLRTKEDAAPILQLESGAHVELTISGVNSFVNETDAATIHVTESASLRVTEASSGELHVENNSGKVAAIGANASENCGSVEINGGVLDILSDGTGIGGNEGSVRITGGTITIDAKYDDINGTVAITGGSVKCDELSSAVNDKGTGVSCFILPLLDPLSENVVQIKSGDSVVYEYRGPGYADDVNLYLYLPNGAYQADVNGVEYPISVGSSLVTINGEAVTSLEMSGDGWALSGGVLTITSSTPIVLSGCFADATTVIADGVTANVTISGVYGNNSNTNVPVVTVGDRSTLNLTVEGVNMLLGGEACAGISVPYGSKLVITEASTGILSVVGGEGAAGIGAGIGANGSSVDCGIVEINGGNVVAYGGEGAAGIGTGALDLGDIEVDESFLLSSGFDAYDNEIEGVVINGGNVVSYGGGIRDGGDISDAFNNAASGAGIGGGVGQSGGSITINGGSVKAFGSVFSAGIGGGMEGCSGTIAINGGEVLAEGGAGAAGIGGGADFYALLVEALVGTHVNLGGNGQDIAIAGGTVTATGGVGGAGIGGGLLGAGGSATISGGTVTATGGAGTPGIGAGGSLVAISEALGGIVDESTPDYAYQAGDAGEVVITGGSVKAVGDTASGAENIGTASGSFMSGSLTDGNGHAVHCVEFDRSQTSDSPTAEVIVYDTDGSSFTYSGSGHEGDTSLYFYLKEGEYRTIIDDIPYLLTINADGTYEFTDGITANGVNIGTGSGEGWSYDSATSVLTISGTNDIVLAGVGYNTHILVAPTEGGEIAHLTFDNLMIYSPQYADSVVKVADGATLRLTLVGHSKFTSYEGEEDANGSVVDGYAAISVPVGATLVITAESTGKIQILSGVGSAGIGGNVGEVCGEVYIAGGTFEISNGNVAAAIGSGDGADASAVHIAGGSLKMNVDARATSADNGLYDNGPLGGDEPVYLLLYPNRSQGEEFTVTVNVTNSVDKQYVYNYVGTGHANDGNLYFYLPEGEHNIVDDNGVESVIHIDGEGNSRISGIIRVNGEDIRKGSGDGWTFDENTQTLTIAGDNEMLLQGWSEEVSIVIADNVTANLTCTNLSIDLSMDTGKSAISVGEGSTLNLTAVGDNTFVGSAGAAGIHVPEGSTLLVTGESTGSVLAVGGTGAAGIGGGAGETAGAIRVQGGALDVEGGTGAAGIGGGADGNGGDVDISGGSIVASGDAAMGAADIGGGAGAQSSGTLDNGAAYGEVAVHAVAFPIDSTLESVAVEVFVTNSVDYVYSYTGVGHDGDENLHFQLPSGIYKTVVNGDENTAYTICIAEDGTVAVYTRLTVNDVDVRSGSGEGWFFEKNTLMLIGENKMTISGRGEDISVVVTNDLNASVAFDNLALRHFSSAISNGVVSVCDGAELSLTVFGTNRLVNTEGVFTVFSAESIYYEFSWPGIRVPDGAKLIVTDESTGSLHAEAGIGACAIGGGLGEMCGDIEIHGGEIIAVGGAAAAGIGTGVNMDSSGDEVVGSVLITGGAVTAEGGYLAVSIDGQTIDAAGAGIGGGMNMNGLDVTIVGGSVKAAGYSLFGVADIGGGAYAEKQGTLSNGETGGHQSVYYVPVSVADKTAPYAYAIEVTNARNYTYAYRGSGHANDQTLHFYLPDGEYVIDGVAYTLSHGISANGQKIKEVMNGEGWSYADGTLTILDDTEIVLSGTDDDIGIVVADGITANLVFSGLSLDTSDTDGISAASIGANSTVYLTVKDDNSLVSAYYCAGINVPLSARLVITGESDGSLAVQGGSFAAGIGGDSDMCNGVIEIHGGEITAIGGQEGAGIGGGTCTKDAAKCGAIIITGGTVTATGGMGGAGIGTGWGARAASDVIITGGSVKATGRKDPLTEASPYDADDIGGGTNADSTGTLTNGDVGGGEKVYLVTIPIDGLNPAYALSVTVTNAKEYVYAYTGYGHAADSKLYIYLPEGEYDVVVNDRTEHVVVGGGVKIDGVDIREGAGDGWVYADGVLTITGKENGETLTITGQDDDLRIVIAENATANVAFDNLSVSGRNADAPALTLEDGATLVATLTGTNTFVGASGYAGINVPVGTTFTVSEESSGAIHAYGGVGGAGIGGNKNEGCGTVVIGGGMVHAESDDSGAGIGGGYGGSGGIVTVTGGDVVAIGGYEGAGIGSGYNWNNDSTIDGGTVNIENGTVTAIGGERAAGIGGGYNGNGADVNITGGSVKAVGNELSGAADIGGGRNSLVDGTLDNGEANGSKDVYLVQFLAPENLEGAHIVLKTADGTTYSYDGVGHADDETLYFYLPAGAYEVVIDGETLPDKILVGTGTVTANGADVKTVLNGEGWAYADEVLTINGENDIVIAGWSEAFTVKVPANRTANLTLATLALDNATSDNRPAIMLEAGATLNLTITGINRLIGGMACAAISVPSSATLMIAGESSGSIVLQGGMYAAGLGANLAQDSGTITIEGGTIAALGGAGGGAAIGGGAISLVTGDTTQIAGANGGVITITGGTIDATGGDGAAAIGGGLGGKSGAVAISGGTVTARTTGSIENSYFPITGGAAIGGGAHNDCDVAITGGDVTATGSMFGPGIGGGFDLSVLVLLMGEDELPIPSYLGTDGAKVTITGGRVKATGGLGGAGVGNAAFVGGGEVAVSGGVMMATGGWGAAGVSGGAIANGARVTISGGTIDAIGGEYGAGIGGGAEGSIGDPSLAGMGGNGGSVVITGGSVKALGDRANGAENIGAGCGGISSGTLDNGTACGSAAVSLVTYPKTDEVKIVFDEYVYAYAGEGHDGDDNLYFYLPQLTDFDGNGTNDVFVASEGQIALVPVVPNAGSDGATGDSSGGSSGREGALDASQGAADPSQGTDVTGRVLRLTGITPLNAAEESETRPIALTCDVAVSRFARLIQKIKYGTSLEMLRDNPEYISVNELQANDPNAVRLGDGEAVITVPVLKDAPMGFFQLVIGL